MKNVPLPVRLALAAALAGLAVSPARAKVIFTGYADLRLNAQSLAHLNGPQPLLTAFGIKDRRTESRSFSIDSLGLFATTNFNETTDFLFDVTYKKIAATVGETRIQYAYLDYHPDTWDFKAGRVTLPIGYYNRNYFYPFQRDPITPPLYQSAIIGLPIADHGAIAAKTTEAGPVVLYGAVYAVNGYGSTRSSTSSFRGAGIGQGDSLLIANNLRDTNSNPEFAFGGNFRVGFLKDRVKLGVSSYQGAWSADGKSDFTMLNAYLAAEMGRVNLVSEVLRTDTDNDKGMEAFFNARDWKSNGNFVEASYAFINEPNRRLALFLGTEQTVAQGKSALAQGREKLTQEKGGLAWKANPFVTFKTQLSQLSYDLPIMFGGASQTVNIKQYQILFGMTLTY